MPEDNDVYDRYDVPRVVNAVGNHTRIGGSLIRPAAREAMSVAAADFVELADLQAAASELIADATGAEAGYVTNGAASGLALATAACLAGDDYGRMNRLPDTGDAPDEVLIPSAHHIEYDFAFRLPGATLRRIGMTDNHTGFEQLKPWEIEDAISEETVAFAYVDRPRNTLSLDRVIEVTDRHHVPVIVDAAAELPPRSNLSRYLEQGAAAVVFSGGKAIRGPQATGIVAGDQWLVRSIALQHLPVDIPAAFWDPPAELIATDDLPEGTPNHGIGRAMKVGKEELAGAIRALELFCEEDQDAVRESWADRAGRLADGLADADGLDVEITGGDRSDPRGIPTVTVRLTDGPSAAQTLVRRLRAERPRIVVGESHVADGAIVLDPRCLREEQLDYVISTIRGNVESG